MRVVQWGKALQREDAVHGSGSDLPTVDITVRRDKVSDDYVSYEGRHGNGDPIRVLCIVDTSGRVVTPSGSEVDVLQYEVDSAYPKEGSLQLTLSGPTLECDFVPEHSWYAPPECVRIPGGVLLTFRVPPEEGQEWSWTSMPRPNALNRLGFVVLKVKIKRLPVPTF